MKILKRSAAIILACAMMLCTLTACDMSKIGSAAQGLYNGATTWVSNASSAVDKAFQGTAADITTAYNNYNAQTIANYRQEVLRLVNEARAKENLKPLTMSNSKLTEAAQKRAVEISQKYAPIHKRPDGSSCFTVLGEVGITSYKCAGENMASGWVSPEFVVNAWLNSPSHRANIMSDNFTEMGVGYYFDLSSPSGSYCYWTQMFLG